MGKVDRNSHIENNMRTGILAAYHFLGTDQRSLADILASDQSTTAELGLTHADIAKWLTACLRLDRTLSFSELNIHLIEKHSFYAGEGSPYRIDPAAAAAIFGGGQLWVIS